MIKTTAAFPDMWQEIFMISLQPLDGTEYQLHGITEEITSFPEFTKEIEGVSLANGGRRVKWTPEGDCEITMKVYDIDCKLGSNGLTQFFHPQTTPDSEDPIKVVATRNRKVHQVVISWAEDLSVYTTAGQASTADKAARRFTAKNVYITKFKESSDNKNMSAEVTFKFTPFGRTGNENYKYESTESTAIPAATSFTTAVQFSAM